MVAALAFRDSSTGTDFSTSGIGFFGASFGASVLVGAYQTTTFITDANGTVNISQMQNVQFLNSQSGVVGSSTSGINVLNIPNFQAGTNVRFTNGTAVKTQNVQLIIYDRSNINNVASGVLCKVYETIHPAITQSTAGSGATTWAGSTVNPQNGQLTVGGSGLVVTLTASPGTSGFRPNGAGTTDIQHDWYVALSASPSVVGSQLFGMYVSLQYL